MLTAIILFVLTLGATFYDKCCVMLDPWEKPKLYHSPTLFPLFFITKAALALGAYAAFYRASGLPIALGAAGVQFAFGSVLLRIFFRRRVAIWCPHFVQILREKEANARLSDGEIAKQAAEMAQQAASKAMKDET